MKILRTDNPEVSDEMIDQLINQVSLNNDGKINFEEFVIMLRLHEDLKESSKNSINEGIPDSIMS
jgi:Ca2+-binding EF-hand superfamily protein